MGCAFARQPGRRTCPRPLREGPEALFHKALARPLDRDTTGRDLLSNLLIREPFVGFQQDAGARHLASRGPARANEVQKRFPFVCG
jgi:hypothetical protein